MTIQFRPHTAILSDFDARQRIRTIIESNPAIESSVYDLVDHDLADPDNPPNNPDGTIEAKRNRAIFAVYIKNVIFRTAVDAELDRV
jgi:hypothetical protein